MEKEFLEDRRRGLEEAFFAEHDAALRRRLREAGEAKAEREALSAASGITDTALLERLVALGISSETLTALSVIPMVAVAWADGKVDELERRAVLSGAERLGVARGEAGYELLEGWLGRRPPRELLPAWRDYIAALSRDAARERPGGTPGRTAGPCTSDRGSVRRPAGCRGHDLGGGASRYG